MKVALTLYVCLVLVAGTLCIKDKERMQAIAKTCMEANDSTQDVLRNFRLMKLQPGDISDSAKCGMHCFLNKSGIFNDQDDVNFAVIEDLFSELKGKKDMIAALEKCEHAITNPNKCERAFQSVICARNHLDFD